ncbi:hypothetical protein PR048_002529 [Dryococelus australis]|uniref:Uncharacterized protein n=1 Tax=Dryococelus australis TaxID=614101 RepID=A0ABQ9IKF4_9NEOP|nr:hypothetical protein PR048_002529 [Dryococelus australis]
MHSRIAPEGTKAEAIRSALQHLQATRIEELVERASKAKLDYQEQEKAYALACLSTHPPPGPV